MIFIFVSRSNRWLSRRVEGDAMPSFSSSNGFPDFLTREISSTSDKRTGHQSNRRLRLPSWTAFVVVFAF